MSLDIYLEMELDTGGEWPFVAELFEINITHNLGKMADEAGIYKVMWRPNEIERVEVAGDVIQVLEDGILKLRENPDYYKQFNPPSDFGVECGTGEYRVMQDNESMTVWFHTDQEDHLKELPFYTGEERREDDLIFVTTKAKQWARNMHGFICSSDF